MLDSLRHVLFVTPVECSKQGTTSFRHLWSKQNRYTCLIALYLAALTETFGMQANGYIMHVAVILAVSCLGEDSEGLRYFLLHLITFDYVLLANGLL